MKKAIMAGIFARKKPGGISLRVGMAHQIGALVLMSLIIFGAITGLIIRGQYAKSLRQDLIITGQSVAQAISNSLQRGLLLEDSINLRSLLKEFSKIHGVAYIVVFGRDGGVLGHTFEGEVPRSVRAHETGGMGVREIRSQGRDGVIHIAVPSLSDSAASIHVGMDLGVVESSLERVFVIVWRIVLVSLLCAMSVGIIVYLRIIRPIDQLNQFVRQIGRKTSSKKAPVRSRDELGTLARSLEQMNEDLRRYHEQLESKTAELEISREELQRQNEEIKRAQAQMIRSEKFASMGQLAASVAHEISNPLAGILTYLKLIRRKLDQGEDMQALRESYRRYLLTMEKETERCGHIVKNLLDFSRSSEPDLREIEIHRVIEDTLFLLHFKLLMSDVKVEKQYEEVPFVTGDFGQLKQVFLNVILNAIEAMKNEERLLRISTHYHRESRTVLVEIQDTGEGINEENIYRVFDPFFTTKPRGTGMGLAVVYGILDKHNADIIIDSDPSKGTKVTIQLNVAQPEQPTTDIEENLRP